MSRHTTRASMIDHAFIPAEVFTPWPDHDPDPLHDGIDGRTTAMYAALALGEDGLPTLRRARRWEDD